MQRWEYLDVYVYEGGEWADSRGGLGQLPGLSQKGWDNYYVPAPLSNALGAEGWELAGIIHRAMGDHYILLFKRPRA